MEKIKKTNIILKKVFILFIKYNDRADNLRKVNKEAEALKKYKTVKQTETLKPPFGYKVKQKRTRKKCDAIDRLPTNNQQQDV